MKASETSSVMMEGNCSKGLGGLDWVREGVRRSNAARERRPLLSRKEEEGGSDGIVSNNKRVIDSSLLILT